MKKKNQRRRNNQDINGWNVNTEKNLVDDSMIKKKMITRSFYFKQSKSNCSL